MPKPHECSEVEEMNFAEMVSLIKIPLDEGLDFPAAQGCNLLCKSTEFLFCHVSADTISCYTDFTWHIK